MADEQIEAVRQRIDALDAQLLQLVNERARLAQEIGHLKQGANDAPVYRPEREAMIISGCSRPIRGRCPGGPCGPSGVS